MPTQWVASVYDDDGNISVKLHPSTEDAYRVRAAECRAVCVERGEDELPDDDDDVAISYYFESNDDESLTFVDVDPPEGVTGLVVEPDDYLSEVEATEHLTAAVDTIAGWRERAEKAEAELREYAPAIKFGDGATQYLAEIIDRWRNSYYAVTVSLDPATLSEDDAQFIEGTIKGAEHEDPDGILTVLIDVELAGSTSRLHIPVTHIRSITVH